MGSPRWLKNGNGHFLRMTSARQAMSMTAEGRAALVASLDPALGPYEWIDDVTNLIPVQQSSESSTAVPPQADDVSTLSEG